MTSRKSSKSSFGRDSYLARNSVSASASKLPRSTPSMHSAKKMLPSHTKSASKRSSYYGGNDHHMMKDPRPLTEKGYMRKCISGIIAFLSDMAYPHPLTPKLMNPPTSKEYFRMVEFTYSLMCPGYKMVVRPEEETAKILFDLCYPFNVSKSTLNNIGAMSAWPNALGALHWLVDLVKYCNEVIENDLQEMQYSCDKKQEAFHGYLQDTYNAFMEGKNPPFTEIDNALSDQIAEMTKDVLVENTSLKAEIPQLEAEKKTLEDDKAALLKMEHDITNLQESKKKLEKYLIELDKYNRTAQEQCDARETTMQQLETMVSQMESENRDILSTVTGQELSKADVQNMELEAGQDEKRIETIKTKCQELQDQCFEEQIQQSKMIDKINMHIVEYMGTCKALELIPIDARNADGIDFSLSTDRAQLDENVEKQLTVIRPKLIALKSSLVKEFGKLQQERNHNETTKEQLKDEMADIKRAKDALELQLTKLREEEGDKKAELEKVEERELQELERVKGDIQSLKTINSLAHDEVRAQVKVEEELLRETESRIAKESENLRSLFHKLCEGCIEYKEKFIRAEQGFNADLKSTCDLYLPQFKKCQKQLERDQARLKKCGETIEELEKNFPS